MFIDACHGNKFDFDNTVDYLAFSNLSEWLIIFMHRLQEFCNSLLFN